MEHSEKSRRVDKAHKRVKKALFVLPIAALLLCFVAPRNALGLGNLEIQEYRSIAPDSIPRTETPGIGTDDVGMAMLRFINDSIGSGYISISSITVELTGTIPQTDIDTIKVYFENMSGNDTFDRGGGDDADAIKVGTGPYDFSTGTTQVISLDPNVVRFNDSDSSRLYVAFDFDSTADITKNVGCEILSVVWGSDGNGTGNTRSAPSNWSLHNTQKPVDDYEATLTATGIAPAEAEPSETRVGIVKLSLSALDSSATANIDSIRLHRVGTGADSDIATGGVILYDDSGSVSGSFDAGDQELVAGSLSGGYVVLNPASDLEITSAGAAYFVAVNIAANAQLFKTIGLEIENPSNDMVFKDVETDPYVSVQYTQQGYITSTTSTPSSGNTVSIKAGIIVDNHISIAPASIPRAETPGVGTDDMGMAVLKFRGTAGTQSLSSVTVELTGTVGTTEIERIRVYFEAFGGNELFDRGGGDDADAVSGGPYTFDAGTTKTISLNPATVQFDTNAVRLYVAFDFAADAGTSKDAGCEIKSLEYGAAGVGTGNTRNVASTHNQTENIDDYEATITATGTAPLTAVQSQQRVGILKLTLTALDPDITAHIDTIRLHRIGTGSDSDVAVSGVILYDDSGSVPGALDMSDQERAAGSLSGGYVTLDPGTPLQVTPSGVIGFIAMNIATDAQVDATIGLEIENPKNDITFTDVQTDPYVSVQYIQIGYITSTSTIPSSGNVVTITELNPDITPPTVSYTNPENGAKRIQVDTKVVATFSEDVDAATVTSSTFLLKDGKSNPVAGSISHTGLVTTFTPASPLSHYKTYTVTVTTGVKDLVGNPMAENYVWSFTTIAELTDISEPIAANNRILPGSSAPVKIYIPEPEDGPNSTITVQIFTIKGQRIATLVDDRPYSQIADSLPLLWYGKNGRQKKLGPGLYFIQIRTESYKKILKVLIVR